MCNAELFCFSVFSDKRRRLFFWLFPSLLPYSDPFFCPFVFRTYLYFAPVIVTFRKTTFIYHSIRKLNIHEEHRTMRNKKIYTSFTVHWCFYRASERTLGWLRCFSRLWIYSALIHKYAHTYDLFSQWLDCYKNYFLFEKCNNRWYI